MLTTYNQSKHKRYYLGLLDVVEGSDISTLIYKMIDNSCQVAYKKASYAIGNCVVFCSSTIKQLGVSYFCQANLRLLVSLQLN
jgi:hypothetical protein